MSQDIDTLTEKIRKIGGKLDLCKEAKRTWSLYQDDIKAGHSEGAAYWKGQAEVYSSLCVLSEEIDKREKRA